MSAFVFSDFPAVGRVFRLSDPLLLGIARQERYPIVNLPNTRLERVAPGADVIAGDFVSLGGLEPVGLSLKDTSSHAVGVEGGCGTQVRGSELDLRLGVLRCSWEVERPSPGFGRPGLKPSAATPRYIWSMTSNTV